MASGVVGHASGLIDVDRLLWVPNFKRIFLPSPKLTLSQILEIEHERMARQIKSLFEQDSMFYANIARHDLTLVSQRTIRIPLEIKPGLDLSGALIIGDTKDDIPGKI